MDRNKDIIADHLPLEQIMIANIFGIEAPENWVRDPKNTSQEFPPVIIAEDRGFSLVANHRTVWHLKNSGKTMVKCLVVRSVVHVRPAHMLINNCTEEAMLFEALLRREIVSNRSRLADMLGYSRARITQLLNQLKLPVDIRQKVLLTDDISEFKLRPLLKLLNDEDKLQAGFSKLMEGKLSGRQMEVFANSNFFDKSAKDKEKNHEKKPLNIVLDDPENAISELEHVFASDEDETLVPSLVEKSTVSEDTYNTPKFPKKQERIDMSMVLRKIGSIRGDEWRMRLAEFNLPSLEVEFLEAVSKLRTGLYTEAMTILSEIVSDDSDHHLAWFYLGRCCNLIGSFPVAEEYLRNAVSRVPKNPDYLVELAIVLEKLKRHSEAEAFYRKSAKIRKELASGK